MKYFLLFDSFKDDECQSNMQAGGSEIFGLYKSKS